MAKEKVDRRLARIEGQIRGLRRMLAEDEYCADILNQLNAVRSALDQVGAELVVNHVQSCILGHHTDSAHAEANSMTTDELFDELRDAISRLAR